MAETQDRPQGTKAQADQAKKSGLSFTVPVDNRPTTSAVLPRVHNPVYDEDQQIVRTNVLLRNETTVNINEYDPDIHGPMIEETDDEYKRRMSSAPSGRMMGAVHPRTTIPNLHSFDSTQISAPPPVVPLPQTIDPLQAGMPVVMSEEPNPNLLNPPSMAQTTQQALEQRQQLLHQEQQRLNDDKKRFDEQQKQRAGSTRKAGEKAGEKDEKK